MFTKANSLNAGGQTEPEFTDLVQTFFGAYPKGVAPFASPELISTAPELLAFLELLVAGVEGEIPDPADPAELLTAAKILIAKARGLKC